MCGLAPSRLGCDSTRRIARSTLQVQATGTTDEGDVCDTGPLTLTLDQRLR
jgi:hypothetical protein